MKLEEIIDINKTVANSLFKDINYIWEVLPKIKDNIIDIGNSLDKDKYTMIEDNIWIGKNVQIDKLSTIIAPCIIGENTEIIPGAYLRGNVVIGDNCIIGNSVEIKNSIIFSLFLHYFSLLLKQENRNLASSCEPFSGCTSTYIHLIVST